jgi:hypothetical protein
VGRTRQDHAAGRAGSIRRRLVACLLVAPVLLLPACRPNKRYDLIEAELRTRERELIETRAALEQSRALNHVYDQQRGPGVPGARAAMPAGNGPSIPVRDVQLARGTGGMDEDGVPGDETLMLVVVPRDEDGSAVKVPARLTAAAWQVGTDGIKTPIGAWDVPPDKLRGLWKSGLISTGYFVPLSWQTYPATERVRVAVRLTTTDGRVFEADRDVTVRPVAGAPPVPGGRQLLLPGTPPPGVPGVLPPGEELPPPSELGPDRGARLLPPVRP